ncbi:MAG: glycosyltransferase family 4 protein [Pseudomonadota bacterium]
MRSEPLPKTATDERAGRFIYIACPWTPKGGGMFKVADYLIQAQARLRPVGAAELRPLDTRGDANAAFSLWVLTTAIGKLIRGRLSGELAGVHVNMAERLSLFRKSAVVVTSRALGLPVVLHLHAAQLHHFYQDLPRPLQALTRWVFSLPDSCVVLGHASRKFVCDTLGVSPERVEIIINGVPEPTQPRRVAAFGQPQRVLFVGNLSERKGVSDLLQALALPTFNRTGVDVTIAGGGDVKGYEEKARALGVDGFVHFAGWSDQDRVAHLMAEADLLVLPSYDEGLPLVILEALANGVAVVCSPVGEIPSVLADGVSAVFVAPGDIAGIASGLDKVLRQPDLRERLEKHGRTMYEQQFSLGRFFASVARVHKRHFGIAGQARPNRVLPPSQESTS